MRGGSKIDKTPMSEQVKLVDGVWVVVEDEDDTGLPKFKKETK